MPDLASALAAASIGAMLFFSAVIAPTVFEALPAEEAGGFLRALFPKYFLINGVAGVVAAALAFRPLPSALLFSGGAALILSASLSSLLSTRRATPCSPATPRRGRVFAGWHRLSVVVNVAAMALFAVAAWPLPGSGGGVRQPFDPLEPVGRCSCYDPGCRLVR